MFSAQSMPRAVRIFILALAIVATLGVATASVLPAHFHEDSSQNNCSICFVAHTAGVETPSVQPVYGLELAGQATLTLPFFGYQAFAAQPHCSRGPPSSSL